MQEEQLEFVTVEDKRLCKDCHFKEYSCCERLDLCSRSDGGKGIWVKPEFLEGVTGCDGEAVEAWRRSSLVVSDVNDPGPLAVRGRSLVSGPVEQNKESE